MELKSFHKVVNICKDVKWAQANVSPTSSHREKQIISFRIIQFHTEKVSTLLFGPLYHMNPHLKKKKKKGKDKQLSDFVPAVLRGGGIRTHSSWRVSPLFVCHTTILQEMNETLYLQRAPKHRREKM